MIPCTTAKKIAVDLVKGDSAKAELTQTTQLLQLTEQKVELKDSIIQTYIQKEVNYTQQISLYKEKESKYVILVSDLEKDNVRLRKKTRVLGGVAGTLVLTTLVGFLLP
jgi:uncharacterized protein YlaN (UPF0358 family)